MSGSGVEFAFRGKRVRMTLCGDPVPEDPRNRARIGFYVNGVRVRDELLDESLKTYTVFESEVEQEVIIRVIKLSEMPMSTAGLREIETEGGMIRPTPERDRKIEFIGDSITAGYGVDDEDPQHTFSTETEDVTKTYAFKTAAALDADYSIVAFSGYGIISGYSGDGQRVTSQLVPHYYDKVGDEAWDFKGFVPDLIVINLGTNDDSYAREDRDKQEEFASQYTEFLKQVRAHNPDARMLCTLGIMGDRLYPFVEQAVAAYTQQTGDTRIATMKFDVQKPEDGYSADWHPSEATQNKAAEKLTAKIREWMGW